MNRVSLDSLFASLQDELEAALRGSRALPHQGLKGEASEGNWLKVLEALPWRYQASRAMVIDSRGQASEQIDLVIHDRQYSPLLFRRGQQLYVPAESVYAVFEIKQALSRRTLRAAGAKAASVRRLHRTSGPVPHVSGIEQQPRPPFRIPAGILCFESRWTQIFGSPFRRAMSELEGDLQLDLGCVLRRGAFNRAAGSEDLETSPPHRALVYFFISLLQHLQRLATVPAIEYSAYLEALG